MQKNATQKAELNVKQQHTKRAHSTNKTSTEQRPSLEGVCCTAQLCSWTLEKWTCPFAGLERRVPQDDCTCAWAMSGRAMSCAALVWKDSLDHLWGFEAFSKLRDHALSDWFWALGITEAEIPTKSSYSWIHPFCPIVHRRTVHKAYQTLESSL